MELKPCPFCGKKLIHRAGKRVNRYYKGEPILYVHYSPKCFLHGIEISAQDLNSWNRRQLKETCYESVQTTEN